MKKSLFASVAALVAMAMASAASAATTVAVTVADKAHDAVFGYMASMGMLLGVAPTTITRGDVYTGVKPLRIQPFGSEAQVIPVPFTLPAAAPVAHDTQAFCKVPAGVQVVDWAIMFEDHDSGANSDVTLGTLDPATLDLDTTWKTGVTQGQGGTLLRCADSVPMREATTAERVVGIKWVTGAAGGYGASKKGLLLLTVVG